MNKEIKEILENVMYWDTCPDDYKSKIKNYLETQQQNESFVSFVEEVVRYYEDYDIGDVDLYNKARKLINPKEL
jgi:hypothetical protein